MFADTEQVRRAVASAVEFYNTRRPHMSIGMLTPALAAEHTGELPKLWKSFRTEAIKKPRLKILKKYTFAAVSRGSFRATPSSQPLTVIRTTMVTLFRNKI